jgi:hypothetical protein
MFNHSSLSTPLSTNIASKQLLTPKPVYVRSQHSEIRVVSRFTYRAFEFVLGLILPSRRIEMPTTEIAYPIWVKDMCKLSLQSPLSQRRLNSGLPPLHIKPP